MRRFSLSTDRGRGAGPPADPESGSYGVAPSGEPRSVSDFATLPVPRSWTLRLDLSY